MTQRSSSNSVLSDHRVRRYIGSTDIESASEAVQRAKENLRASVMRSIDDTQDVYPVYLQPSNWATYLSTKFKPEDLLSSESVVREQLFDKEKQRSMLILKLSGLKNNQEDVKALEKEEITAKAAYSRAQREMTAGFSDTSLQLIEMYFTTVTRNATNKVMAINELLTGNDLNEALKKAAQPPLALEDFRILKTAQQECLKRQYELQTHSEALARASMASASARGEDSTLMIAELTAHIEALTIDINYLKQSLSGSLNPLGVKVNLLGADKKLITTAENPGDAGDAKSTEAIKIPVQEKGASVWQDFMISLQENSSVSQDAKATSTMHKESNTSFWIGSASESESAASTTNKKVRSSKNTSVDIGFRVMKVVINRPWMNAGILHQTQEFYHANGAKISGGEAKEVKEAFKAISTAAPLLKDSLDQKVLDRAEGSLLPTWPVAFIIAKDLHIIMKGHEEFDQSEVANIQKKMDSGGGFLCFSTSKSENSNEHRTAAAVNFKESKLSIKIPAPQIIGWVSHTCPKDETQAKYKQFDDSEFKALASVQASPAASGGGQGSQAQIQAPLRNQQHPVFPSKTIAGPPAVTARG